MGPPSGLGLRSQNLLVLVNDSSSKKGLCTASKDFCPCLIVSSLEHRHMKDLKLFTRHGDYMTQTRSIFNTMRVEFLYRLSIKNGAGQYIAVIV